jgi:hypothetical protein
MEFGTGLASGRGGEEGKGLAEGGAGLWQAEVELVFVAQAVTGTGPE